MLAYFQDEPGADRVLAALVDGAAASTVNMAEVYSRLIATNQSVPSVAQSLRDLDFSILPFTEEDAVVAAELIAATRASGISLGDCACLATAIRLKLPVLTADRRWLQVRLGITVELCRP